MVLRLWNVTRLKPNNEVRQSHEEVIAFFGEWYEDESDSRGFYRGFPYVASEPSDIDEENEADNARQLAKAIPDIIASTTFRGFQFDGCLSRHLDKILSAPGIEHIESLEIDNLEEPFDTVEVICSSPVHSNLRSLKLDEASELQLRRLGKTRLKSIRSLSIRWPEVGGGGLKAVLSAAWTSQLRELNIGISEDDVVESLKLIAGLPRLHTLALWDTPIENVDSIDPTGFPALGRLWHRGAPLGSEGMNALASWPLHSLKSLSVGGCGIKGPALKTLSLAKAKKAIGNDRLAELRNRRPRIAGLT